MLKRTTAFVLSFLITSLSLHAQNGYSNYSRQTERLNALAKENPKLVKLKSIAKTAGGKDIWMMTIGSGNADANPAIAVVGGVEGNHLLGMELAIGFAEKILSSNTDSIRTLLSATTFYIFPNMSPDAMEQYFAPLKYERQGNAVSTDDDRDGHADEDGYDDLDGNGKITMMRVTSPVGEYKINPEDARSMVKADFTKGEKGGYLLYTEGLDNDKDNSFNEDGAGGVWFNKNFTYRHPSFTVGSGEFAVSENEDRALLDQLYALFNIYAVVSFSSNNNLSTPFTYNAANAAQRIVSGYQEADAKVNAMVSDLYNKTVNMKDAPKSNPAGGDFLSWAYYHYGRFSFSTPGWFVPKAQPDTAKKEKALQVSDSVSNYLRWASAQNITPGFTEWKKINHPDFPGQVVEVGGIDPFVLINPPYNLVADLSRKHTDFITRLAGMQPRIELTNIKKENMGGGLTRVTATVMNTGVLPSYSKLGERSYFVKRINVKLNLGNNQSLISGKKVQLLNSLEGYGTNQLTWLVRGSGKIELEAGSPTTGIKKVEIIL